MMIGGGSVGASRFPVPRIVSGSVTSSFRPIPMPQSVIVVDAFTGRAFAGNPAAVCVLPSPRDDEWMRAVAGEMNLAETAFLNPEGDGYRLRWLTPTVEVDLCGHATLASAHVLWETGALPVTQTARFQSRSGLLTAQRRGKLIELDFPATPPVQAEPPAGLIQALGVKPVWIGKSRFDYLVEVGSEAAVRDAKPDHGALSWLGARGVMVTAKAAGDGFDFVSRFFAPGSGIAEDSVTGSAHCALAPHWGGKLGKKEMIGHQISARGGVVHTRLQGDRVILGGEAVTVMRGELVH